MTYRGIELMMLALYIAQMIAERQPKATVVDSAGVGAGVASRLREMRKSVMGLNVGESASRKDKFFRIRDELWWRLRDRFESRLIQIPNDDELIGELASIKWKLDPSGKIKSTDQSHYPHYKRYSEAEHQEKDQAKMAEIGVFAEQLFFLILQETKTYWHQPVRGILSLTKTYPKGVVELACKRALSYGAWQYHIIRNICQNGAYALPVEFEVLQEVTV